MYYKISVIVPVYNVENYLRRCVDSILNQTFTDFELILVDDGSNDRSGDICDEYMKKDDRVRVIHKKNGGVSAARNVGIDTAQGEFIMFVDSDDYIDSTMLENMYPINHTDIVFSGIRYLTAEGKCLMENTIEAFQGISIHEFLNSYYLKMEKYYISSGSYNKLYRLSIIQECNIKFCKKISICEDSLFVTNFLQKCTMLSNINSCYYNYVQYGSGNLMARYNSNAVEACEMLYKAKKKLLENALLKEKKSIMDIIDLDILNLFIAFFSQIYTRSQLSDKEKRIKAKRVLQNKTFKKLLCENTGGGLKKKLLKMSSCSGCVLPVHLLWSFRHGKNKNGGEGICRK